MAKGSRESTVERKIGKWAREHDILVRKFVSPGHRGVPDRLFILPGGAVAFLEVKKAGEKPRPEQRRELEKLVAQGAYATWVDTTEDGIEFLETVYRLTRERPYHGYPWETFQYDCD